MISHEERLRALVETGVALTSEPRSTRFCNDCRGGGPDRRARSWRRAEAEARARAELVRYAIASDLLEPA